MIRWMLPIAIVATLPASADVVFNDFGAGNSYQSGIGNTVSAAGSLTGFLDEQAMAFTPSGNFTLSQIDVAIGHVSGTNSVMLSLNSDSGGLPGGAIESWTLTSLPQFGMAGIFETVTPVSSVTLTSGTQYWVVASPIASDTWDAWNLNNTGSTNPAASNSGGGWATGETTSAFDVLGTPAGVPEPTSIVLLATVLGSLAFALRRRFAVH